MAEMDLGGFNQDAQGKSSVRLHPQVRIGHVHLKVADLERALEFYCGVLGFALQQRFREYVDNAN